MNTGINSKNTKSQILEAYDQLLNKVKQNNNVQPKEEQVIKENKITVKAALQNSDKEISNTISNLKSNLLDTLDKLGENLLGEYKKLSETETAIKIQEQRLEDLYKINAEADSLATLILVQQKQQEGFDKEMAEKKQQFEIVKQAAKTEHLEHVDRLKKQRGREEDEYNYKLKTTRKKEEDHYLENKLKQEKELKANKISFEKDISEREQVVTISENELKELRIKADKFPKELEIAVVNAKKEEKQQLDISYNYKSELTKIEVVGELKLKEHTITTLESKIKDLELVLKEMSVKSINAEKGIKDIAMKALETSNKVQVFEKQEKLTV